MRRFKVIAVMAILGIFILSFQNCGSPSSIGTSSITLNSNGNLSAQSYVDVNTSVAQSMLSMYENTCNTNKAASMSYPVLSYAGIINGSGNVQGSLISNITGTGNVNVYGTGTGSKVTAISGFTGNVVLCDIDLDSVSGPTDGNLVIDGGDINIISGFNGNVFVINGDFPAGLSHFKGNVFVKTTDGKYAGRTYNVP